MMALLLRRWCAHPGLSPHARRLLHLKGLGKATLMSLPGMKQHMPEPPGSETGTESSEKRELQWSEAFDGMCSGAHPAVVEVAVGMQAHLAVSTSQVRNQAQVEGNLPTFRKSSIHMRHSVVWLVSCANQGMFANAVLVHI